MTATDLYAVLIFRHIAASNVPSFLRELLNGVLGFVNWLYLLLVLRQGRLICSSLKVRYRVLVLS